MITTGTQEIWFLTGSQHLYGPEVLKQVADQSAEIVATLNNARPSPFRSSASRCSPTPTAIRRVMIEASADDSCVGVIAWMHTFSPAKMWISGLDALRKPLLHLHTQANRDLPWSSIDMDFMNLNQAAHGDREFGFIQARMGIPRKTVTGHVSDPNVAERVGVWMSAARGVAALRTMRLARFGDNMRNVAVTEGDKVEAEIRFGVSVNTYGVQDLVALVDAQADGDVTELCRLYEDEYDVVPELRQGGDRHASLRYGAQIELGLRDLPDRGWLHRLHHQLRGSRWPPAAPRPGRPATDG